MTRHTAPTKTETAAAEAERALETTATEEPAHEVGPLLVVRDGWIDFGGGGVHSPYHVGEVVPRGPAARELLERRPKDVTELARGSFIRCPGFGCGSAIPVEMVRRSGELVVEDAAEAVCALRMQLDIMHLVLAAGDLLELKLDHTRAREVREHLAPRAFRPSGRSIYRIMCRYCQGSVLVAIPKA